MKEDDLKMVVQNLKNKCGINISLRTAKDAGESRIVIDADQFAAYVIPKMHEHFDQIGQDNPELVRALERQSRAAGWRASEPVIGLPLYKSPKELLEALKKELTKPQAPAIVGRGLAKVDGKDGIMFLVMRDKEGHMTAEYGPSNDQKRIVNQTIIASIDLPDGGVKHGVSLKANDVGSLELIEVPGPTPGKGPGGIEVRQGR